jgi:hypothetical protein
MPTIYRVILSDGNSPTEFDSSLAGAVTTDNMDRGKVTPGEYQALLVDDRIVPLPHPAEMATIRQHGESNVNSPVSEPEGK